MKKKIFLAMLALAAPAMSGCKEKNNLKIPPTPDVDVQLPVVKDVNQYVFATGQVASTASVDLVARVQGFIREINYHDGDFVHKGDLLFLIEPETYAAQIDQAHANLESAQAHAIFAEKQYQRYSSLARLDSSSIQEAQQTLSDRDTAIASVEQYSASLKQAKITYNYTHVVAPFDGYVTAHLANIGELVGGSQNTELAQIVQLDKVWVNFNIAEQEYAKIQRNKPRDILNKSNANSPPVVVDIAVNGENFYSHTGTLDYESPQVDPDTGTIALRAIFDNRDHDLLPGNFSRIRILTGIHKNALLVPSECIANDQSGHTIFTVNSGGKIEEKKIDIGDQVGDLVVIERGITADSIIVTDNLQSIQDGERVNIHQHFDPVDHDLTRKVP